MQLTKNRVNKNMIIILFENQMNLLPTYDNKCQNELNQKGIDFYKISRNFVTVYSY